MSQEGLTMRGNIGAVLMAVLVVIPGMIVSGFMPELDVLPLWGWCIVTSVGGMLAGGVGIEQRPILGAISGLVGCVATIPAILLYVAWRAELSDTFMIIEFVIPVVFAMIPGFIVFRVGRGLSPSEDEG